jgi:hypothetical protein
MITTQSGDVRDQIGIAGTAVVEELRARAADVGSEIRNSGSRLVEEIVSRTDEAQSRLNSAGAELAGAFARAGDDLRDRLEGVVRLGPRTSPSVRTHSPTAWRSPAGRSTRRCGSRARRFRTTWPGFETRLGHAFETQAREAAGTLETVIDRVSGELSARLGAVGSSFEERGREIAEALGRQTAIQFGACRYGQGRRARHRVAERAIIEVLSKTGKSLADTAESGAARSRRPWEPGCNLWKRRSSARAEAWSSASRRRSAHSRRP